MDVEWSYWHLQKQLGSKEVIQCEAGSDVLQTICSITVMVLQLTFYHYFSPMSLRKHCHKACKKSERASGKQAEL